MAWQSEDEPKRWPTASTRLNWARNNYTKYPFQRKLQRFLVMQMNLIALNDLIEEEGGEPLLTPKLKQQWVEMYHTFRPTNPVGRPKSGSETGPTE